LCGNPTLLVGNPTPVVWQSHALVWQVIVDTILNMEKRLKDLDIEKAELVRV